MLSLILNRYYEPLRLPLKPALTSRLAYRELLALPSTLTDLPLVTHYLPLHAISATPEDLLAPPIAWTCFHPASANALQLSPPQQKVSVSKMVNEDTLGSPSLRPVALPLRNLRPRITPTPLRGATEVNGQFLGRDFNPLDNVPFTAYVASPLINSIDSQMRQRFLFR